MTNPARQGPWPTRKSPRERLDAELSRLSAEYDALGSGSLELSSVSKARWLEGTAKQRLVPALQMLASGDDVEAIEQFARSETGRRLIQRGRPGWALKVCERSGPRAMEAILKEWVAPGLLTEEGPRRTPNEGALRCVAAALARHGEDEGVALEIEATLTRAMSGSAPEWAAALAAEGVSRSLPNAEPLAFGRAATVLLTRCPPSAAGLILRSLTEACSQALSSRRGEQDEQGAERVWECSRQTLKAALQKDPEKEFGSLSADQAWAAATLFTRNPGLEPELFELERAFAPGGFYWSQQEAPFPHGSRQGLFWGQIWGDASQWKGRRLSLVSAALFQGNKTGAEELLRLGCWWSEADFFEMAKAFESFESFLVLGLGGAGADARAMGLLRRSVAMGEALALQNASPEPAKTVSRSL